MVALSPRKIGPLMQYLLHYLCNISISLNTQFIHTKIIILIEVDMVLFYLVEDAKFKAIGYYLHYCNTQNFLMVKDA